MGWTSVPSSSLFTEFGPAWVCTGLVCAVETEINSYLQLLCCIQKTSIMFLCSYPPWRVLTAFHPLFCSDTWAFRGARGTSGAEHSTRPYFLNFASIQEGGYSPWCWCHYWTSRHIFSRPFLIMTWRVSIPIYCFVCDDYMSHVYPKTRRISLDLELTGSYEQFDLGKL